MSYLTKHFFKKRAAIALATVALLSCSEALAINKTVLKKSLNQINAPKPTLNENIKTITKKKISKISVVGSNIFHDEIQNLASKYNNEEFTKKLEEELKQDINSLYNNHGYILSYAHDITLKNSTLVVEIYEGSFRNITTNDEKLVQNKLLNKYIEKLKAPHPFRNTPEMERTFALIKRLPGFNEYDYILEVKPLNKKEINKHHPQTADLIINVDYHEFEGMASINNRHKTNYKKQMHENNDRNLEYNGSGINTDFDIDYNNPLNNGDKASFNTSYGGKGDLVSLSASYMYPLNIIGTNMTVTTYGSHSSTYNGTTGSGAIVSISHPLYLTKKIAVDSNFAIETYHENYRNFGKESINKTKTDITKASLGTSFIHKISKETKYYIGSEIQKSIKSVATPPNEDTTKNREFTKFLFSTGLEIPVHVFKLSVNTQAQISNKRTPNVELMQIGQEKGGRGFRSGEIKGNKAITNSAELSYNAPLNHHFFLGYRSYGFFDIGYAKNSILETSSTLASAGIGNELFLKDNIIVTVELAKPLIIDRRFNHQYQSRSMNRTSKNLKVFGEVGYFFNF